ncbi:MAG: AmmeMemoRadiSam system protein B [Chloroflexi bacterium]|nr:AmmeMemoRadiSam system protein B [Chloroflexota bacterium]
MEHEGERLLALRDQIGLIDGLVLVPAALAPLLALCDGSRDVSALCVGFRELTGAEIRPEQVAQALAALDEQLILEGDRCDAAKEQALAAYREAACREPALAGKVYPGDVSALRAELDAYGAGAKAVTATRPVRGIVTPHIDYQRGGPLYARLWQAAAPGIQDVELAIVFGTDHQGGPGRVTLTRQSYATPYGVLRTPVEVVDALADLLGADAVFEDELHHRTEHSVELGAVWLHHALSGRDCEVLPILCGSFHEFVASGDPEGDDRFERLLHLLRIVTTGRRTLIVSAADLAHVGPAFGDSEPWSPSRRELLRAVDDELLQAICAGDARTFFERVKRDRDCFRICGLPPTYLALRLLGGCEGEVVGYAQCDADLQGGSLVSIAGALLY